ncbi:MAG: DUF885 family protein [Pseudomonadota bacterium]
MPSATLRALRCAVLVIAVPIACAPAAAAAAAASASAAPAVNLAFDAWAERFAADWVRLKPERATTTQYFSGAEQAALDRQLTPLDGELFRARRLVVDTGLHSKGWTRQQAIDYGIGAAEVERYVARPGQACAYMLGMLRILALRDQAQAALGPKFSLPAFHDLVLGSGSVPLDVLATLVEQWIAEQKG